MSNTKYANILIRLPLEMKEKIAAIAKSHRRSLSNYVRLLIENDIRKSQGVPPIKP